MNNVEEFMRDGYSTRFVIIGAGFVGQGMAAALDPSRLYDQGGDVGSENYSPKVDTANQFCKDTLFIDPFVFKEEDGCVTLDDVLSYVKFLPEKQAEKIKYIICVPTPSNKMGECDDSIAKDIIETIIKKRPEADILIKSTISLDTANLYQINEEKYNRVCFSPEFLRGRNAVADSLDENKMIVGSFSGSTTYNDWICNFMGAYLARKKEVYKDERDIEYKHARISFKEALIAKYAENMFLAMRVTFFNEIYRLAVAEKVNYSRIVQALSLDPRIGDSHSQVPGPDGEYGWGGHCLPKDTSELIAHMESFNLEPEFFKSIVEANKKHRFSEVEKILDDHAQAVDGRPPHALDRVEPHIHLDAHTPISSHLSNQRQMPRSIDHGYALDKIYDDDGNVVGGGGRSK